MSAPTNIIEVEESATGKFMEFIDAHPRVIFVGLCVLAILIVVQYMGWGLGCTKPKKRKVECDDDEELDSLIESINTKQKTSLTQKGN